MFYFCKLIEKYSSLTCLSLPVLGKKAAFEWKKGLWNIINVFKQADR